MNADTPSNAFHCPSCDVWGALPECWCCGRTAIIHVEKLISRGGMQHYRENERWVRMNSINIRVEEDVESPF